MFVSSYNTYIHTNTTDKSNKTKDSSVPKNNSKSFASKLHHTSQLASSHIKNTPINYINNSKIFNNRQKLQQNMESRKELTNVNKFNTIASQNTAKVSYIANSIMFSIVAKPKPSLANNTHSTLTSKKDENILLKEKVSAINTYLANDRYYRITA